ncbi:uncharacterized protein LOC124934190 isoform X1 [Impatiens glandulifera]|uniref:uncharacterized protein LOC124934190 isoform X1 n=1 Tax=Impatiens glandulifera TaxID=253017 RepID=UPI001FB0AA98|nr:uncharacterized protein LOC124934190 isoform X1 [Impatiens glandulifera]
MASSMMLHSDLRSAIQIASTFGRFTFNRHQRLLLLLPSRHPSIWSPIKSTLPTARSISIAGNENGTSTSDQKVSNKPPVCTADELHFVSLSNSDWRLALWRYIPPPQAPLRNRPLLLLSGVATNAIGYDLSPESSFARYMCGQGFDTWILEVRGAGLSMEQPNSNEIEQSAHKISEEMEATAEEGATKGVAFQEKDSADTSNDLSMSGTSIIEGHPSGLPTVWDESELVSKLTETFMRLSERLSGFLSDSQSKIMSTKFLDQLSRLLDDSFLFERFNEIRGNISILLEARENSAVSSQIKDLSKKLVNILEESQLSVSPQIFNLQDRFFSTIEDFQKQLDLIVKYDWDFDCYLEEDVPTAMEYIRAHSQSKDGKLFAIGHSMGGILLYAMLSRFGSDGKDPKLAAVVTLASSLDYTSSSSSLKLLLPLVDPAQALNVPGIPLGAMLSAAYPLTSRPPFVLSWLNDLISAQDMMHPELLRKLVLNNFCTVPAKVILQLTTAFREGGLCDRSGKFFYNDHLSKSNVPVLALAGDRDLICPPKAVHETVKLIPEKLGSYKEFGEADGPHYAHYDLVGGRLAVEQVYPCIIEFLTRHD